MPTHEVCTPAQPTCLKVWGYVPGPNQPALKNGIVHESHARNKYRQLVQATTKHQDVNFIELDIKIHERDPFLRASPAGLAICSCCGQIRLLQIKCPFTAENQTIREAMAAGKIPFLEENNDMIELSKTSRGYDAQVQCDMAVTHLLISDCIVLEVPFDNRTKHTRITSVVLVLKTLWKATLYSLHV